MDDRMKTELDALIGKRISEILINPGKDYLAFIFAWGAPDSVQYYADGDCCSQSWIEHINGIEILSSPALVTDVADRDMPEAEDNDEYNCIRVYGWTIKTDRGYIDIEMRNSSNGYYGGMLMECVGAVEGYKKVEQSF